MKNILKDNKAFSVVELLVVIVVIAILATISVASYGYLKTDARKKVLASDIKDIKQAMEIYRSRTGSFPKCSDGRSECEYTENSKDTATNGRIKNKIENETGIKGLSDYGFRYVTNNSSENWGLLFFSDYRDNINKYNDAPRCKFGFNMYSGWWGGAPDCDDVL